MQKTRLFLDFSLFYVTIWTYFIDSDLLPSFTLHWAIIPTSKYEPVNGTILIIVDYLFSRDAPSWSKLISDSLVTSNIFVYLFQNVSLCVIDYSIVYIK